MKPNPTYQQLERENEILHQQLKFYKSNDMFNSFFENNKAIMLQIDTNTQRITNANKIAINFYGYPKNEFLKKSISDLNTLSPNEIKKLMTEAVKNKSNYSQFKHKLANGKIKDVEIYSSPFRIGNEINLIVTIHDITKQKNNENKIKQRETYITALNKASSLLLKDHLIPYKGFIGIIGEAASASRTYIFKNHKNKYNELVTSQIAEYCAKNIHPEIDNPELQNLSFSDWLPRWEQYLSENKIIKGVVANFPETEKSILEPQGIKAILIIPLFIDKLFWGFIGFDNCITSEMWNKTEQQYLETAARNLEQKIKRHVTQKLLKAENKRFNKTMNAIDAIVYVSDIETYELLYLNDLGKKLTGDKIGEKCYSALQKGQTKPCEFCTNNKLLDKYNRPKEPYIWEFQNTKTKQWYQCRDQAIQWIDGRIVRIEVATDITDRKQVEKSLESEKIFSEKIIETSNAIIIGLDHKHIIRLFNKGAEKTTGYKKTEVIGKDWFDLFFPKEISLEMNSVWENAWGSSAHSYNNFILNKKGERIIISWQSTGMYTGKDINKHLLISIGEDITDRIEAEQALKDSEIKLDTLLNATMDIAALTDKKGVFLSINNALVKSLGVKKEELIGANIFKLNSDVLTINRKNNIRKVIKSKKPFHWEDSRAGKYFDNSVYPIFDEKNKIKQIALFASDITGNKKAQQALKESEEKFRSVIKSVDDMIFVLDKENRFVSVNTSKENLLLKPEMFIGKKHSEVLPKHIDDLFKKAIINVKNGKTEGYEYSLEMPNGLQWYSLKLSPIINDDKFTGSVAVIRDITENKKSEILLQKSKLELERINTHLKDLVLNEVKKSREKDYIMMIQAKQAAMGEMIGSIAHQWRQPLNEIGIYIQNLQERYEKNKLTSENFNTTIEKTMRKLEYMSQTIDDFRNFFMSDKQKIKFSLTENIINTLLLTEASFKNNFINVNFSHKRDVYITGYPNEFSQAILNILNNAKDVLIERKIKNRVVDIKLTQKNNSIVLTILDNAGGVDIEIIDKIFEPYFTTKSKTTGTGLGLYITKTIIEHNMNGKLSAMNIENGTQFKIEFLNL